MSACERCDFIGPELPSVMRDARELHRAMHGLIDALMDPISGWQMRMLDRALEARGKVSPSITISRDRRR